MEDDIKHGCFGYRVHPCLPFKHHLLGRILKYISKGFQLRELWFDNLCSRKYENYIIQSFKHVFGPELIEIMVAKNGKKADEVVTERIVAMLGVNQGI